MPAPPVRSASASPLEPSRPRPAAPEGERARLALLFAGLFALTLAAYLPALRGELLWDDAGHVTSTALQSWSGLVRIWFEPGATQQYYPLLHTAFWLEHRLWGDATLGYHLVNILWHATAGFLFFLLLRRLAVPGALLAALLFLLHPVSVESVAWISEQKNTLSLLFALAAAVAYFRFNRSIDAAPVADPCDRGRAYALASGLFLCALLTKTVTASLPAALLVILWWKKGRLDWRGDIRPLLPWLAVGAAFGLGTAHFERALIGAQGADFTLGATERVLLAGRVVWFYVGKLLWPADLAFFYPRWTIDAGIWWQWLFPLATVAALAGGVVWSRRDRAPLAAALLFGGVLFPVLGFVNVYPFIFSFVADHFQYHASLAVFALFAAAAVRGWQRLPAPRGAGVAGAALVLLVCAGLTWRQAGHYRDDITLYRASLARNPESWVAHLNLGVALSDRGSHAEALPHLQRADALKPDHPETLNTLGNVLNQLGRSAEALRPLDRAVQVQPRFAAAHNTRGAALMALGRPAEGIAAFQQALSLDPGNVVARINLGWALANTGRPGEALVQLEQARRAQPENADAEFKTGLVYAMGNRPRDAETHLRRAVALQPTHLDARCILGTVLLELGRAAEAAGEFENALEIAPGHPTALRGLQEAYRRLGR
jgi:tetratricopeptide (TPR) repeat protein